MHPDDLPTITKRQADRMVADAVAKALAAVKPVVLESVKKPEIVKPVPVVESPLAVSEEKPVMPPAVMDEAWADGDDDAE